MKAPALHRLGLPIMLALALLALLTLTLRPLEAQAPPFDELRMQPFDELRTPPFDELRMPRDPLAPAALVGLNQAYYVRRGYADAGADLVPVAPASFPQSSPTPSARSVVTSELDHHTFLPLVRSSERMTEARALWVTRWDYSTITDVQTLVDNAAGAGFNMLLFQVRGVADAFYAPGLEPWASRLSGDLGQDPGWDPLQVASEAARARGMELHAYVNVYPVWPRSPDGEAPSSSTDPEHLFWALSYSHTWADWRVADSSGAPMSLIGSGYLWATPALTDVVDRVVSVTADLAARYVMDGIHLDIVRYPGRDYSYDPFSEAGYEAALALEPELSRAEWQRRQVTLLVQRVYSEVILPRPELRLSTTAWPVYRDLWGWGYSEGYSDYYQDSQRWMLSGTVDALMPMIYPADAVAQPEVFTPTQFSLLASDFLTHSGGRHVFPGISAQYTDFDEVAERIAVARELGAPGHAIFSARLVAENDYWDEFAAGPYARPATVPPITWRTSGGG